LPEDSLIGWVPINARGDQDVSGNKITAMTTPIHSQIAKPLERLTAVMRSTQKSKAAQDGVSARLMTDITQHIPSTTQILVAKLVLDSGLQSRACNCFISNVPGPQIPLYMNGAKCLHTFGLAPLGEGMGLFIATPSYNGEMSFNVISTREILPDIDFFVQCLRDSFDELIAAAEKKATQTTTRKRRAAAAE
ncbi:MAG: WS/DGAT domain-containing protein, partial [Phycisphaerales bacterium]|nr:WS/DGAT domain-containing protein [Phycisphaerales bacterium]